MPIPSLQNTYIDETYQRLVQVIGNEFADGTGSAITFGPGTLSGGTDRYIPLWSGSSSLSTSSIYQAPTSYIGINTINPTQQFEVNGNAKFGVVYNISQQQGDTTTANGGSSHAEGYTTETLPAANYSHVEGQYSKTGKYWKVLTFVDGVVTFITDSDISNQLTPYIILDDSDYSGNYGRVVLSVYSAIYTPEDIFLGTPATITITLNDTSINSEGLVTNTSYSSIPSWYFSYGGNASHAEGDSTVTVGQSSHAEGAQTTAVGSYSHAEGEGTITYDNAQHVQGRYNIPMPGIGAFIIGNGTNYTNRSNLLYTSGSQVQITGSLNTTGSVSFIGLTSSPQSNVVTIDTATGQLYYTASSAFGGGGSPVDLSGYVTTSSFNSFTSSYNTGSFTGSFKGQFIGTASWATNSLTASFITASNVYGPYGSNSVVSASYAASSSYAVTASYVTTLNQNVVVSGAIRLDPTTDPSPLGNTFLSSSFLFQSSSNTSLGYDLYIRQDGNLVKWKWIEGALQTGLLYGGVLSYSGTTASISSGSGIIVNYNASTGSEINPQVQYVTWPSQSIKLGGRVTSSQATYVYIDSNGVAQSQDDTFFTNAQYASVIPLGIINHSGRDVITSVSNNVYTAYNTTNQVFDFAETFGPLKVTGLTVTGQTGTLRVNVGAGESFVLGGFYQQDPNNISHKNTSAYLTASIARVYASGSTFITDNNGGSFYTVIDPTKYNPNNASVTASVAGGSFSIQRVFFNPFTGRVHVYYGQRTYNTIADARANLASDPFDEAVYTAHQYVFVAYLLVNGGATDLTNTNDCVIVQSGIFRNTAGSSGATTFTTRLQDLSNVTITSPTNGQALIYNGGNWINGTPASASNAVNAQTASYLPVATYNITSSWATNSLTASYLNTLKASSASVASFGGSPLTSSVTFGSAYSNNNYSISIVGEDARIFTIQSKSSTGFTINTNSTIALTGPVYWTATPFNP